jgi:hypothetical protein|tara:strand:- start:285 stop:554 length:270 start_codon:yes stop_codon:yes gene_type:complete
MKNETLADWLELLEEREDSVLVADGFDDAFIGMVFEWGPPRAVYSYDKCVNVLMERDKASYEAALEYMEFNVVGAYMGEQTPLFIRETP